MKIWALILTVLALASSFKAAMRAVRCKTSNKWPQADAVKENGSLEPSPKKLFWLNVSYSYEYAGQKYGGTFSTSFDVESEGLRFLESLKGGFSVRVNPNKPEKSVLILY